MWHLHDVLVTAVTIWPSRVLTVTGFDRHRYAALLNQVWHNIADFAHDKEENYRNHWC